MRGIGGGMGSITPEQNIEGTMVISIYNPKTQELVWRGIAQETLNKSGNKNPADGGESDSEDVQAVAEILGIGGRFSHDDAAEAQLKVRRSR